MGLIDNKNKDILILERPADGLDDITLTEVNKCYINFPKQQRILCIIMRWIATYLLMEIKKKKIKAKVSEINASQAYLANISKDFKNTRLDEYVFDLYLIWYMFAKVEYIKC